MRRASGGEGVVGGEGRTCRRGRAGWARPRRGCCLTARSCPAGPRAGTGLAAVAVMPSIRAIIARTLFWEQGIPTALDEGLYLPPRPRRCGEHGIVESADVPESAAGRGALRASLEAGLRPASWFTVGQRYYPKLPRHPVPGERRRPRTATDSAEPRLSSQLNCPDGPAQPWSSGTQRPPGATISNQPQ